MTEWKKGNKFIKRSVNSDYGGSMRLGSYKCKINNFTLAKSVYKKNIINERHRHRFEMNINYEKLFKKMV